MYAPHEFSAIKSALKEDIFEDRALRLLDLLPRKILLFSIVGRNQCWLQKSIGDSIKLKIIWKKWDSYCFSLPMFNLRTNQIATKRKNKMFCKKKLVGENICTRKRVIFTACSTCEFYIETKKKFDILNWISCETVYRSDKYVCLWCEWGEQSLFSVCVYVCMACGCGKYEQRVKHFFIHQLPVSIHSFE